MDVASLRAYCRSLPHTTEQIQWGDDLVFKIGGKMYAVFSMDHTGNGVAFKSSPEEFAELIEMPGIVPAPYLARAKWVMLEYPNALPAAELKKRLARAYELVRSGLTKKVQAELGTTTA